MLQKHLRRGLSVVALCAFASACASREPPDVGGYRPPSAAELAAQAEGEPPAEVPPPVGEGTRVREIEVPGARTEAPPTPPEAAPQATPRDITPTRVSFENAPLSAFINAVFAETLGFGILIDPAVATRTETITLRSGDRLAARDLFDISAAALSDYGVEVIVQSPRTLRFTTAERERGGAPMVFRGGDIGRDAAIGDNPIYYYYTVRASNMNTLVTLLQTTFGQRLQITGSPAENALLLTASPTTLRSALDMLESFDQPRMAGKLIATIEPVFFTPTRLSEALARVLRTAGYGVSTTPDAAAINILPLDEVGVLMIFSQDEELQRFAVDWARNMDAPRQSGAEQAFVYFVQNTDAESLARVMASALGGAATGGASAPGGSVGSLSGDAVAPPAAGAAPTGGASVVQAGGMRIAVDPGRNALIFMGRAEQYASVLPLLRQLDRSPGEVLIEVVLAEVTITDRTSLGVEFELGNDLVSGTVDISGGTSGTGLGSTGLSLRLFDNISNAQVFINALASRNRVNILSNPRIVSKSGADARIQVGTQVPVLRQQSSDPSNGQTGVTNEVDYIDTGVVLHVRPVIRADSRVDLEISQEVSEAQQNDTSDISSPLIFTRSITTSLSLRDGQTVLLGGLKSQNRSNLRTGVPGLSSLPVVGALFQSQSAGLTDTELLIFITPYIVSDPHASDAVVERYRDSMRQWPRVSGGLQWWAP